jgi:Cdc6-like AAA superfamily ATPase
MSFKNPITYLSSTRKLSDTCIKDLELKQMYNDLLKEDSESPVREMWMNNYTTNTDFLKETQKLLTFSNKFLVKDTEEFEKLWKKYTDNVGFRETYEYITFEKFYYLNNYEPILQAISMYTLTSPALSLISPFLMLLVPFFIIRFKGSSITLTKYIEVLKNVMSKVPIGQIFNISSASWDQRIFMIFSILFYGFQMYQNSVTCYKFYRNSKEMYETLHTMSSFGRETISQMTSFENIIRENNLNTYNDFLEDLDNYRSKLEDMSTNFEKIKSGSFTQLGLKMKHFYDVYCDEDLHRTLNYAIHFHEYLRNLNTLSEMIEIHINPCKFSDKKSSFKQQFYAPLRDKQPCVVKNNYKISKNGIISGPNASGKTTQLKSTLFNIIISQQIGMGFYKSAYIIPQHHLHCYINIPDTNDRDSLFQAEARKCKEILEALEKYPNERHFCVFDELFSGTNPYEAVASATAYLQFLHKHSNINYMLTTHYIDLCKNMDKKYATNYTMIDNYCLKQGISTIKGGIKVLEQQKFPLEIIEKAKKLVS